MTKAAAEVPAGITVLNVNDRVAARYVITKMLEGAGYTVLEAATGLEAIEVAREHRPNVVILDIKLPDIDGLEVCRRLKADSLTEGISVVQTSATYSTVDMKIRGLDVGADSYLMQPFSAAELAATVNSLVRMRRTEQVQRKRAEAFAEADRKKDEFLAMLAHELRNPLAAIVASQGILDTLPARNDLEKRARAIGKRQAQHLSRLIDDLLDVSRVTRGKIELHREPVALAALLRGVADSARSSIESRNQVLELALDAPDVHVEGDRTRLEQVFTNLLDNASKYTDAGGSIRVSLGRGGGEQGDEAVVTVADNGIGIASEALSNLFNLFYQAETGLARGSGGLGIGLTLVRSLVELHGGRIEVRSDGRGKGSEFEVRLPVYLGADAYAAAAAHKSAAADGRQGRRILIVEDNADARATLRDLCELWGHSVETASDGFEGVRRALEWEPDLALVDVGLPGIDGFEVARRVRGQPRGRDLNLVALTGYGTPEDRDRALKAGFDLHLTKPADPEVLFALLRDGVALHSAR